MKIKQHRTQSNVERLEENGQKIEDPNEVNLKIREFFANLYSSANPAPPETDWLQSLDKLSEDATKDLEKPLTTNEISNVLFKHSKTGKSPGNDGLTVEFYRTFWKELREPLMKALRESIACGELSSSQKQSVIRLIPKKGRDGSKIKNWRPISLMNVAFFQSFKHENRKICALANLQRTNSLY